MADGRYGDAMQAIVVSAQENMALERVPDPTPEAGEIVVRVRGCGICGTDLHIIHEGLPGMEYPLIPGHEPWGEVADVNGARDDLQVGDLVAADPSLHCGHCFRCLQGQGNQCLNWGAIGGTRPGAWADFVSVPAKNLYKLEPGYPTDCASIIEPVACAIRGMVRLSPRPDRSAIIFGGGTMGLLLAILLDIAGVGPITIVEANARRRDVIAGLTTASIRSPEALNGEEAEYVIDATGNPQAMEAGLQRVAPAGTFMVFGVASPHAEVAFSPYEVYRKEITIVGSMAILHTYPQAVRTVRRHAGRFRPLLTHSYDLAHMKQALDALAGGESIKVTVSPSAVDGHR